jgi:hypothetical protein
VTKPGVSLVVPLRVTIVSSATRCRGAGSEE